MLGINGLENINLNVVEIDLNWRDGVALKLSTNHFFPLKFSMLLISAFISIYCPRGRKCRNVNEPLEISFFKCRFTLLRAREKERVKEDETHEF